MQNVSIKDTIVGNLYHRGLQMLFMGIATGFLAGVVVTFYNILVSMAEGFSMGYYEYIRDNWFLIPVLLAALFVVALGIGVVVKLVPLIKGSGIPQTEGVARGELRYKNWFVVMCSMFACSLACVFFGLSAGGEGPSVQIGGCCGYGSSRLFSRTDMLRRYQVTGGACAGLAVAFNAPLTGMAFAFEEAHKRFSSEVFICAFSSVVVAVITRNLIRGALGLSTGAIFTEFVFNDIPLESYGFVVGAAIVCALLGVLFYNLVIWLRNFFDQKVTFLNGAGKMTIPFVIGGVLSLVTVYAMGGGHALIEAFATAGGTKEMQIETIASTSVLVTLTIVLIIKFFISILNMGVGVPCGVFIPMLAIGATVGGVLAQIFTAYFDFDPAYSDLLVMVCMAAFFACIVRAPITAMVMVCELTWNFTFLLPIVVGVAVGYMVGEIAMTKPIYDVLLERILMNRSAAERKIKVSHQMIIIKNSIADGMRIRDILWPAGTAVRGVHRGETSLTPDAELVLREGDSIYVETETFEPRETERELALLVGHARSKISKTLDVLSNN